MIAAYLELVLAGLSGRGRVEKINGENLNRQHHISMTSIIHQSSHCPYIFHLNQLDISTGHLSLTAFDLDTFERRSCAISPHRHDDLDNYEGVNPYHIDGLKSRLVCIRSD